MKIKAILVLIVIWLLWAAKGVFANEGNFRLAPSNGSNVSCFVTSVYQNGSYRILGTCRGLVVAYSAEQTRYALWKVEEDDDVLFVADVDDGKIWGSSITEFDELYITAERPSYARQPEGPRVAEGTLEQIEFVGRNESGDSRILTPTPAPENNSIITRSQSTTSGSTVGARLQSILRTIGKIVIIGFLILLVLVIVMTVITRRKEKQEV